MVLTFDLEYIVTAFQIIFFYVFPSIILPKNEEGETALPELRLLGNETQILYMWVKLAMPTAITAFSIKITIS